MLDKPLAMSITARKKEMMGWWGWGEGIRTRAQGHWYPSCTHYKAEMSCQEFLNGA